VVLQTMVAVAVTVVAMMMMMMTMMVRRCWVHLLARHLIYRLAHRAHEHKRHLHRAAHVNLSGRVKALHSTTL
jgi:hypothetical protein